MGAPSVWERRNAVSGTRLRRYEAKNSANTFSVW